MLPVPAPSLCVHIVFACAQACTCVPSLCIHVWMAVFPCLCMYIWLPLHIHVCTCVCALGGSGQGRFCIMCPSGTSFPKEWTLPVSPLPPWHCLCPHIRIPKAPAVDHEPFLILHSYHRAEGNLCIHKSLFRMGHQKWRFLV